ncbi:MAG: alkaline phosphatase family protein, partial [Candidatus Omnitrophica bacterium]|nr:alkaline phosphatase family protein [Candidatus Omnitrophota bacterium]
MRGLILIQIDGLAGSVLRRAMKENRMPFISEMSKSKDRRLWTFYSGIPSNTPSVQGEIFYGIRQCVPAFQFRDRRTRKKMTMYECGNAQEIEERLQKQGAALLSEGSSYGNIFTGGAKRFAFCITALQFSADFFKFSVMRFARFLVLNPFFCAKTILQMAGEVLIGVKDVLSGVLRGEHVTQELYFVFTRVIGSIFLRNWITVSTVIDMREKLPVIHLNYFGYDEQAHRRGPTSEFALWSLKGIDDAVKTVCRAAEKLKRRYPYDVWIYSDHGQEESRPYSSVIGNDIKCIIENYFRATEYKHGRHQGRQDVSLNEWQKLYAERLAKSGKSGSIPPVNEE